MASVSTAMRVTHGLVRWSPCSLYLASADSNTLVIRDAFSLQIIQRYSTLGAIQMLSWSEDSQFVLTASLKRAVVQLWSVQDASWNCKISEVSDFQLHATVWSLEDPTTRCSIRNPKLAADGIKFTKNGLFLAVLERHDCKDSISIYSCESWEHTVHFSVDSYDCAEIAWSSDNATIAVRDTNLEFRLLVYSLDGTLLTKYKAYENALGLKSMAWSASGQFLALESFDNHLRVLSHVNWKPVADFDHESIAVTTSHANHAAIEYEESFVDSVLNRPQGKRVAVTQRKSALLSNSLQAASAASQAAGGKKTRNICFVTRKPPFSVRTISSNPLSESPKIGKNQVLWSADSSYLASKCDQMPYNVWIWQTETLQLHSVVSLLESVRSFRWDPTHTRLAITSGVNRVYMWTTEGVSWIDIPSESFQALSLQWAPSGDAFIVIDRQSCCLMTL
ncbi:Uncharacterized conserved protein WDR8, contains WD repeats [Plasmopara halstedii]|uniref:Uncharacterized conserved protein WDR8, contains WD repeats n=1 Tax=Plasmopara halstedii TaxID=4781 RepID=A0A0N7L394_PLAHL|nr:Uncharacterized conserved protein WDR8, contains WD repeats [Plasmopara halstedii]CEG35243.1 Uncharacterized conserved protein WDR8, contains WD repeats [Plasmopara halstedii]|eukprot:XP_024571612.1 Uncharacterized conserved protein WDR8, contains WD repeats [Plasmopara halstedii]